LPGVDERARPTAERLIDLTSVCSPTPSTSARGQLTFTREAEAPADRRDLAHKKAAKHHHPLAGMLDPMLQLHELERRPASSRS
jgi:hypothetical protein